MQKRLCGREQEFGVLLRPRMLSKRNDPNSSANRESQMTAVLKSLIGAIAFRMRLPVFVQSDDLSNIWLGNGSRIYRETGSVLEASSAETLIGTFDNLLQEKALELIISEAAEKVVAADGLKTLLFYKNNVAPKLGAAHFFDEGARGSHHNYSYKTVKDSQIYLLLENFLPVALPFSGNGHIWRDQKEKFHYLLSQRARHIKAVRSILTTYVQERLVPLEEDGRGIINTKLESLMAESSGLSRLHLICRDATRCEFQTWLVDMMTHLVLRLAEEDWPLPYEKRIFDPLKTWHEINFSLAAGLNYEVELGSILKMHGREDLWDYNEMFLQAAQKLKPLSETEKKALEEWQRVLELLRAGAYDQLVGELDWVTKKYLIERKMAQYGFGIEDVRAWKIDMDYHIISPHPEQSWFAYLEEEGRIKHLVSREEIEKARINPPETRAKSRGEFVKFCCEHDIPVKAIKIMDWGSAELSELTFKVFFGEPNDPFVTTSESLERFFRHFRERIWKP